MHVQAYVYIIFVYRFVYVDMSTRSSQINHLSLESLSLESRNVASPSATREQPLGH